MERGRRGDPVRLGLPRIHIAIKTLRGNGGDARLLGKRDSEGGKVQKARETSRRGGRPSKHVSRERKFSDSSKIKVLLFRGGKKTNSGKPQVRFPVGGEKTDGSRIKRSA